MKDLMCDAPGNIGYYCAYIQIILLVDTACSAVQSDKNYRMK